MLAAGSVGAIGLLVWYLWPKKVVTVRESELAIDDNVLSPTFGLPYGSVVPDASPAPVALSPEMQRLIDASNAAIAADDAANGTSQGSGA